MNKTDTCVLTQINNVFSLFLNKCYSLWFIVLFILSYFLMKKQQQYKLAYIKQRNKTFIIKSCAFG